MSALAYFKKQKAKFHHIFCTCYPWPWLHLPLAAMQYVMYFGFVDDILFFT